MTTAKLVHLDVPGHTCYGSRVLVFRAFVAPPCDECGGASATIIAPRWLDGLEGSSVNLSAVAQDPQVAAYVPPVLGRCHLTNDAACPFHPYREQWATVTARFDDPVAQTCRYSEKPAGGGFTKADAVAECRAKLVVLSVGPDSEACNRCRRRPRGRSSRLACRARMAPDLRRRLVLLLGRRPAVGRR